MKLLETGLPGCLVVEPRVFNDGRGFFYESWNQARFAALAGDGRFAGADLAAPFVQSNVSRSHRGVLRGLHYQWPNPQGKLVSVLDGEIWDVAVDLRRGSPEFGRWAGVVLSSSNHRQLWVPEGFAHGFLVLSDSALVSYLCTAAYDPDATGTVHWQDPQLAIDWPLSGRLPMLSQTDAEAPRLDAVPARRLPAWVPPADASGAGFSGTDPARPDSSDGSGLARPGEADLARSGGKGSA